MRLEITITFLRDSDGKLKGISLVPEPHTESEIFCGRFRLLYANEESKIIVAGNNVTFADGQNRFSIEVPSDTAQDLKDLLDHELYLVGAGFLVPGFTLKIPGDQKLEEFEHLEKMHNTHY